MKAITILNRCRDAEGDMRRIKQRIQQRREAAEGITPQIYGPGIGNGGSEGDKMSAFVAEVDELEKELNKREEAYRAEVAAACVLLDALPEHESSALHLYYVKRMKLNTVAKKLKFSEGYARTLKRTGEQSLALFSEATVKNSLPAWYHREYL
jgi:DNA-directed RNA polymerase specialized sigma24 family protein